MMEKRKKIPKDIEVEVMKRCRRRCCICYGLNRNEEVKPGQIAHLDRNPLNNEIDNLAFLCLEHHDQYDTRTTQSKGLTIEEVKSYRKELEDHYKTWGFLRKNTELLNFLADTIDLETMADTATKVAGQYVWYGRELAIEALTRKEVEYIDMDLYIPLLLILDHFQSWGWLTYSSEEVIDENGIEVMRIKAKHEAVCKKVAGILESRGRDVKK